MALIGLSRIVQSLRGDGGLPRPSERGVALVTGASSGIGRGYAMELARRGFDIALVARRRSALENLARHARGYGVEAMVLSADLRHRDGVEAVLEAVGSAGRHVQVLVNCAGFGVWAPFGDGDVDRQLDQVHLHCDAVVSLIHGVLPGMVERGGGAVINVASSAGVQPVPYLAVYSASKAFMVALSTALDGEVRPRGVTVTVVNPGPVPTEFGAVSGLPAEWEPAPAVDVDQVVQESLRAVSRRQQSLIPGRAMRLSMRLAAALPRRIRTTYLAHAYHADKHR